MVIKGGTWSATIDCALEGRSIGIQESECARNIFPTSLQHFIKVNSDLTFTTQRTRTLTYKQSSTQTETIPIILPFIFLAISYKLEKLEIILPSTLILSDWISPCKWHFRYNDQTSNGIFLHCQLLWEQWSEENTKGRACLVLRITYTSFRILTGFNS